MAVGSCGASRGRAPATRRARCGSAVPSGRYLGILFATVGIITILLVDSTDGLMLALCGWFIVSSASAIQRNAEVDAMLDGISVADVMDHDVRACRRA